MLCRLYRSSRTPPSSRSLKRRAPEKRAPQRIHPLWSPQSKHTCCEPHMLTPNEGLITTTQSVQWPIPKEPYSRFRRARFQVFYPFRNKLAERATVQLHKRQIYVSALLQKVHLTGMCSSTPSVGDEHVNYVFLAMLPIAQLPSYVLVQGTTQCAARAEKLS
ncbi:uncharacterized protein CYBJADRAFT_27836 [Cyberlindnera jadinii NRRL Y-1542]|uniref:Uncharacterized protein n=1 Tax=Cyberlindnera jadinii (strain ATCC 18201 / CBS 1600 / BCRC 20928 / JCM 3617 / NBRC 0987 / NRRL Y-1542) TaxID=983966 RepID=A0A1E4RXG2_CYBJN|nr:hypothetical protein CYBJADRAFT_27836 [Cyberlindnera jadinii NRRL Y-1542]ODV71775.1 hypothetical protein CYBJADRAFT_27836 [Cyberlindnera jadinii NRRL Y-1542]